MQGSQTSLFDSGEPELGDLTTPLSLLYLMEAPGIGPAKALAVARKFGTWESFLRADEATLRAVVGSAASGMLGIQQLPPTELPSGVRTVGYFDHDYPESLRSIPNPPAVLWVRGSLPPRRSVAIVGTREPTAAGAAMAASLATVAVNCGWGVVSGLALGIDIAAHRAALVAKGGTWAFLGSGVDRVTPNLHQGDAEEILVRGGGLISEMPPGTTTAPRHLVARNRLQSGSSLVTIITQAGVPSGTLHTARFTIEQGRILTVVQPPLSEHDDPSWRGNRDLLRSEGCDPSMLSARGNLGRVIRNRQPAADFRISNANQLGQILQRIEQ